MGLLVLILCLCLGVGVGAMAVIVQERDDLRRLCDRLTAEQTQHTQALDRVQGQLEAAHVELRLVQIAMDATWTRAELVSNAAQFHRQLTNDLKEINRGPA